MKAGIVLLLMWTACVSITVCLAYAGWESDTRLGDLWFVAATVYGLFAIGIGLIIVVLIADSSELQ